MQIVLELFIKTKQPYEHFIFNGFNNFTAFVKTRPSERFSTWLIIPRQTFQFMGFLFTSFVTSGTENLTQKHSQQIQDNRQ